MQNSFPVIRRLVLACLLSAVFSLPAAAAAESPPPDVQIGQTVQVPGLRLPEDTKVVQVERADVTGDRAEDVVLLVGNTRPDNPALYAQLNVLVRDGRTGDYSALYKNQVSTYLSGFEPSLFLGDFTGDKIADVLVTVATGGSGGTYNHLIASWKNNKPQVLFGEKENEGLQIRGWYRDGFQAQLYSRVLGKTFIVDVSGFKQQYIDDKIYDKNGVYIYERPRNSGKNSYDIFSDPFSSLVPVDEDNDGTYELVGKQSVWGPYHAFTFTNVQSTWAWRDGKWDIQEASYTLTYRIK